MQVLFDVLAGGRRVLQCFGTCVASADALFVLFGGGAFLMQYERCPSGEAWASEGMCMER